MNGIISGLTYTMDGAPVLAVLVTGGDARTFYDENAHRELELTFKDPRRQKRSLTANAYAWVLIDKLAAKLRAPKTQIYREAIREIGGVSELIVLKDQAIPQFTEAWSKHGVGWLADVAAKSALDGYSHVRVYYGSSVYDTAQMSRLIEYIVESCKDQGIETMTPAELSILLDGWQGDKEKKA